MSEQDMSEKPISKQRKWQLEHRARGLCSLCNRKLVTKTHCRVHRAWHKKHYQENKQPGGVTLWHAAS